MNPEQTLNAIGIARATAILRTQNAAAAEPAMEAALRGGFRVIEFTLNTPGAIDLIARFAGREGVTVGAGTVMSVEDVDRATDAGATFIVSPVFDEAVVERALARGAVAMPGTHTPTEMWRAHQAGAQLQKLFPAPGIGPKYVKALRGPMPFLRVVPTNGVHLNNARSWLKAGAFAVGMVAPLFDPRDLDAANYPGIELRAEALLAAISDPSST